MWWLKTLYEAACTLIGPELMAAQHHTLARPRGNAAGRCVAAPHGCYPCHGADRWCVIAAFDETQWKALCRTLADPDWTRQERFSPLGHRAAHAEELDALLAQCTASLVAEDLAAELRQAGVPSGVVQNARDLANDPHLQERQFFAQTDHPALGTLTTDTSPVRFRNMAAPPLKPSPLLGQDNRHIFMGLLGLTEAEYAHYLDKGVIG